MQLWQMDVVGGFHLADGTELKAVTGLDDHSRYCVSVHLVLRAASRPTCEALRAAIKTCGVPEAVLTDNGKVFTARFGPPGQGDVRPHMRQQRHPPHIDGALFAHHHWQSRAVPQDFEGRVLFA